MRTAKDLINGLVGAFGDPAAIEALLAPDAEWWITPTVGVLGSPTKGRANIRASMDIIFGDIYADAEPEVHMVMAEGNRASARFTLRARMKIANDLAYENEYCVWIEAAGREITHVWEYLDVAHATAQMTPEA